MVASETPRSRPPLASVESKLLGSAVLAVGLLAATLDARAAAELRETMTRAGLVQDVVNAQVSQLHGALAIAGCLAALAGLAFQVLVLRLVVMRPLRELTRISADIARNGDLSQRVPVRSRDEIGELGSALSKMVEPLRSIPRGIRDATQRLAHSVTKLSASTAEQSETVERQASALRETQVTAEEIRQTSTLAAQKAQTVLEYAERAESISRTGEVAVGQSLAALRDIRAQVEEIAQRITSLGERAMRIGQVTQTVKDLADQSNMLALNAAIEAVRAGEHGKGFSVVAREIRSLADQSIEATQQVRDMLEDISEAIRGAVAITEKGSQRIDAGLLQVKTSGEQLSQLSTIVKDNSQAVRQINTAVGQQNGAIAQILGALSSQGTLMRDTMARLEATDDAVKTISDASRSLVQIVEHFAV
ncbi:MAG: methyl-accepting chemotaxis protein [Myxococcota bacterium]|nr:methyl-accepting chemotaxis protein [Myxococcota bacterium]